MSRIAVTALVLGSCLATSVHATSFIQKHFGVHKSAHASHTIKASATNLPLQDTYVNFSGSWEGTCTGTGSEADSEKINLDIEQHSFGITFNGEDMSIGVLKTESSSTPYGTDFDHFRMDWNSEKTMLLLHNSSIMAEYAPNLPTATPVPAPFVTTLGEGSMSLNANNQLEFNMNMINFKGTMQQGPADTVRCVFNKVK